MPSFWNYLMVFLLSSVPIIELKGSIPMGLAMGIPVFECFVIAVFGSILLSPLIILVTRRVLTWLMNSKIKLFYRFGHWQHDRLLRKGSKVEKYRVWALLLFVAIPLPMTGVWTGSMIAGFFDIRLRAALPVIFIGNCIAGVLVWLIWGFATAAA